MKNKSFLLDGLKLILWVFSIGIICFYIHICLLLTQFPIYTDEISIRVWSSRTLFDFPLHVNIIPSATLSALPIVWYIPGFIEWCLHGLIDSLYTLRLVGVISYLMIAFMLTGLLLYRSQKNLFTVIAALGIVIACISIGVLPVFFIINRPEQIILIGLIILIFIYYLNCDSKLNTKKIIGSLICFYLCVSLMLYIHAKSLYFVPVYFLIAFQINSHFKNNYSKFAIYLFLGLLIIGNYHAWTNELVYHQSPIGKTFMASFNINPGDMFFNFPHFIDQLKQSLASEKMLLNRLVFQTNSQVNYLPDLSSNNTIINYVLITNSLILFFYLLIQLFIRYKQDIQTNNFISSHLLLLLIVLGMIAGNILNLTKNWYDVGYFWAIILITFIAYLHKSFSKNLNKTVYLCVFIYLILCGTGSIILFQKNYETPLLNGFAGPGVSLVHFHYRQYKREMHQAKRFCLNYQRQQTGIVLDDYTYLYFRKFKYPISVTFVNINTKINQFPILIKANKISSIITRCTSISSIPHFQEKNVIRLGTVCCYPYNRLQTLT